MPRVAVVAVPYISCARHFALAEATMQSVVSSEEIDRIAVVNRVRQGAGDEQWLARSFSLVEYNDRNNLAKAWNTGISKAMERGATYILVINMDLLLQRGCIDKPVSFAGQHPELLVWSPELWNDFSTLENAPVLDEHTPTANFSCFMVDKKLFGLVGRFDEIFEPAYHEDKDLLYRIRLAGHSVGTTRMAYFFHLGGGTISGVAMNQDLPALKTIDQQIDITRQLYVTKWGGPPDSEIFINPYNR